MFSRRLKNGYFLIEALNSFATVYFFYYFYYFMQKQFGFDNKANLALAALNGATYAVFSFFGGKFAQRFGYLKALKVGFIIMISAMVAGLNSATAFGCIVVMAITVIGMSLTWPSLEALVSGAETRSGVQHMVGVYNVVWAATAAIGSFTGGALLSRLGLKSLFFVPMGIQIVQLGLTLWLDNQIGTAKRLGDSMPESPGYAAPPDRFEMHTHPPPNAKIFLRLAWLANPFAYIGINTLVAVMPGLALRLGLSTTLAGFCGSVWCFSRLGAFMALWAWHQWHYRFGWLLIAYLVLATSFITVLLAPSVGILLCSQFFFGAATGFIYYSSLFYSMDASDAQGEHGGFHEAAIGLGNFAGPAVGAATLQFLPPHFEHGGAYAVTALLVAGLAGLIVVWKTAKV